MELLDSGEDGVAERSDQPSPRPAEHGHSLTQIIAVIVAGIVLILLLVLLGRWIYHKAHHPINLTPANSKQLPASPSGSSGSSSASKSQASSNKNSSGGNASTSQTGALPNSGPGNVAGIFAGASLAAGGLHYIISLRRFNKTGA